MNFFAVAICVFAVLMFSGVIYDWLVQEANPKWGFILIGSLYAVGMFGFYCVYSAKDRKQPYVLFGLGAAVVTLSFLILEMLLITGFGK